MVFVFVFFTICHCFEKQPLISSARENWYPRGSDYHTCFVHLTSNAAIFRKVALCVSPVPTTRGVKREGLSWGTVYAHEEDAVYSRTIPTVANGTDKERGHEQLLCRSKVLGLKLHNLLLCSKLKVRVSFSESLFHDLLFPIVSPSFLFFSNFSSYHLFSLPNLLYN